ncbi:MAG: DUF3750 domain-containing protein [Rhizobiaceae bacterium]|nr:DUF3750 domain-containing protein [Rhizobiaceae bacterium]
MRRAALFILIFFISPSVTYLAIWVAGDRPANWSVANWSSAGILPAAASQVQAKVYVLSARTGGLKGAISTPTWIVLKRQGATAYNRYDVVGWGRPVRQNAYPADGRWYSNDPKIIFEASGKAAATLIPQIEKAIANYRWQHRGDYVLWPGPNSNSFVASIVRTVGGFDVDMPVTAIGKDFPLTGKFVDYDAVRGTFKLSLNGYAGLTMGWRFGIEINLLGLVAGFDWVRPAIKLPGFGRIG